MSFEKTGIVSTGNVIENGMLSGYNYLSGATFKNYNSGTITGPVDGKYTITSSVTSSSWGAGFYIGKNKILVPYGCMYRVMLEVYVPTAHGIQVDINNSVPSGVNIQGGNDNDNGRTGTYFDIPANTWTTITWGSSNLHSNNTQHVDIAVYDGIGLKTASDSSAITWYMRNPRAYIGYNERNLFGIGNDTIYSNSIIET